MKTILIVVSGMADLPDNALNGRTPLQAAATPALDALAKNGCCGLTSFIPDGERVNRVNALLGVLGYDFGRGVPPLETLQAYGSGTARTSSDLRYFVVPKFSGHGVVITDDAAARGIGMMALMRPVFTIDGETGQHKENPCGTLSDKAQATIRAIETFDFVLVYVDEPYVMSMQGDVQGKIDALEEIDRELIAPVADHVWNAKIQMNLVVTSDAVVSWRNRCMLPLDVPAAVYFNDDLPYDTERFDESAVTEGPLNAPLPADLIKLLVSFEPIPEDDEGKKPF